MAERMKGRCLCGAVQFEGTLKDGAEFGVCHCSTCQHWNGGPGLATEMDGMNISGESHVTWYASSEWAERGFCAGCGSNLFYRLKENRDLYFVQVGCLDEPGRLTLAEHIFVEEMPGHYDFTGNAPRLTGAEFLARLQGE
nr:GFA family protein [uncultured Hyphomonas sp.]